MASSSQPPWVEAVETVTQMRDKRARSQYTGVLCRLGWLFKLEPSIAKQGKTRTTRVLTTWLLQSILPVLAIATTAVLPEAGTRNPPRFQSDILPIFERNCLSCHGESKRQGGLDLRSVGTLLEGGGAGPALVPGSASESLLLARILAGEMPADGNRLPDQEIELIRLWIESGALSEEGVAGTDPLVPAGDPGEREVMVNIFGVKYLACHGRRVQQGGLDLRKRADLLRGGVSGPAIIPGDPERSLLIRRIEAADMPPAESQAGYSVRPVTSRELEKLKKWIAAGAPSQEPEVLEPGPGADPLVSEQDRKFWAFQPPQRPAVPRVRQQQRVRTPIDAFLLARLESENLSFSPPADRLTLMRRAYFALTGLPPTPEEVEAYLGDDSPSAYQRLIDRLLESPRYGERWGRYWLDAVGYADSEGQVSADAIRPHAYRYRDYVIRSLNRDKPYDRFLLEQIAGDELFDYQVPELSAEQIDSLVATGFLRMAPDGTYSSSQNFIPMRLEVVASQVEILSSAVLGLTVACARCHDHKYDPIPQRDYCRFSAILRTAYDPFDWLSPSLLEIGPAANWNDSNTRFLDKVSESERQQARAHNAPIQEEIQHLEQQLEEKARPLRELLLAEKLVELPEILREDVQKAINTPPGQRTPAQLYLADKFVRDLAVGPEDLAKRFEHYKEEAARIEKEIEAARSGLRPEPRIRALFDMGGEPTATAILLRGEYQKLGPVVTPGVPSVLSDGIEPYRVVKPAWETDTSGRRLALARWLTQPRHPLTSRVMVNRIWQHHFGTGLVANPGNFGTQSPRPSHPELLDWMATEFVLKGWSMKAMHRLIMTSAAYRQSSRFDPERTDSDTNHLLLSRFPLRRLDADAVRDTILNVAGRLETTPFGTPDPVEVRPDGEVVGEASEKGFRRSIYLAQRRSQPVSLLEAFDAPQLTPNCLKRPHSTVSSQALQLMNSDLVRESSRYLAGRAIDAAGDDAKHQVERVFLAALSRPPSAEEREMTMATLGELTSHWMRHLASEVPAEPRRSRAQWLALSTVCHTILNSAEFLYID